MTFGEELKRARDAIGLTRQDVATHLGVTIQTVSQWETDKTAPDAQNLLAFLRLLRLIPEDFDKAQCSTSERSAIEVLPSQLPIRIELFEGGISIDQSGNADGDRRSQLAAHDLIQYAGIASGFGSSTSKNVRSSAIVGPTYIFL